MSASGTSPMVEVMGVAGGEDANNLEKEEVDEVVRERGDRRREGEAKWIEGK